MIEFLNDIYGWAERASTFSLDPDTKVGCVIFVWHLHEVGNKYTFLGSGSNNPVFDIITNKYKEIPWTKPEKFEYVIHAEINAVLSMHSNFEDEQQSAREFISWKKCAYVTLSPCKACLRVLYQEGIRTIYFKEKHKSLGDVLSMFDIQVDISEIGEHYVLTLI